MKNLTFMVMRKRVLGYTQGSPRNPYNPEISI
jgi:hypothetical protein